MVLLISSLVPPVRGGVYVIHEFWSARQVQIFAYEILVQQSFSSNSFRLVTCSSWIIHYRLYCSIQFMLIFKEAMKTDIYRFFLSEVKYIFFKLS